MNQALKNMGIQLSVRERNILILAAVVALFFLLNFLIPTITGAYANRQAEIESVRLAVAREQRLVEDTEFWARRRAEAEARSEELQTLIFSAATVPLIEAAIQRSLTQYARDSAINVNSTRLAERLETDGWLMISQEMSFRTANAANTINLLEMLENSAPRLFVKDFSLDYNRNQYTGAITVVGFAPDNGLVSPDLAQR